MRRLVIAAAFCAGLSAQPASLVIRNARVWTGDPKAPWADSVAVSADMITRVGGVPANVEMAPGGRVIDARGRLVTPGFIDSHVHLIEAGLRLTGVQLRDARTRKEFVDRIAKFAASQPPGAWITGGDWDHENWGGELPTRQWIDAVTPRNPVWIQRLDGHMGLANGLALTAAKVSRDTIAGAGGAIVRDARSEPTGVLKDNAMALVNKAVPARGTATQEAAVKAAGAELLRNGVTSVHHMGTMADLALFRELSSRGELPVRVYAAGELSAFKPIDVLTTDEYGDRWIRWGLLKGFMDGSLGSHTAAFEEPYSDNASDRGLLVHPPERVYEWMSQATVRNMFCAVHAIGDRANHVLLNIIDRIGKTSEVATQRYRIEHAQHLRPDDIPRMGKLGILASMQPYHLADDGRWAEKLIGPERAKTTYAFRSLIDAGVRLVFGSDWFVAPPSVMLGIHAAVTRQTLDGKHPDGWTPREKITVEEALRAYTVNGAYAAFEEKYKGAVAPGYLADLVMLDSDITKVPAAKIRDAKVVMTVIAGRVAFEGK